MGAKTRLVLISQNKRAFQLAHDGTNIDLHIISAESIAPRLMRHYATDHTIVVFDSLDIGPVPRDHVLFEKLRNAHWRKMYWSDPPTTKMWPKDLCGKLGQVKRVCIWFSRHLRDQIMVGAALAQLKRCEFSLSNVDILYVQSDAGYPIRSVTSLRNAPNPELRHPIEDHDVELFETFWLAVSDATPESLVTWLGDQPSAPFLLTDGVRRLIAKYPAADTGLSWWEVELLQSLGEFGAEKPIESARIVGSLLHADMVDSPHDFLLFRQLLSMDQHHCANPLIKTIGDGRAMRFAKVVLTSTGNDVLEGRANYVELNGINRWVGGVHLSSRENRVWLREGDSLVRAHIAQTPTETQ